MEPIYRYFKSAFDISQNDWALFSEKLIPATYAKKQILLKKGQVENYLSFLEKGIVRFYLPDSETERTVDFAFDNNFFSGYSSFLTRTPSFCQIETLTEVTLWRITYKDLQFCYHATDIGDKIGRIAGETLFLKKAARERSLLNETAIQRYQNLLTDQPSLLQQIPLKYIAAYIGVTPQALSRIRRRIY